MAAAAPPRVSVLTPRVPVLMYHEIAPAAATPSKLAVAPELFADQMAYLDENGFTSLTAGELAGIFADGGNGLPERPVVVTFDDGYGDFFDRALPVLRQHGLTATVFQTTGWVGLSGQAKRMMNWRELAEVAESGIEIGAHTYRHPKLDELPEKELRDELFGPKHAIEDKLGTAVPGLSYPYGYSNPMVQEIAREAGYTYAYAVGNALTESSREVFTLPRLTVNRATGMASFRAMVNGQDTPSLRRARLLTRGYSVARKIRSAVRI
jgi:peptidoglycan/xylan/chitin deacetylase (PgdA/CDA1 family)